MLTNPRRFFFSCWVATFKISVKSRRKMKSTILTVNTTKESGTIDHQILLFKVDAATPIIGGKKKVAKKRLAKSTSTTG